MQTQKNHRRLLLITGLFMTFLFCLNISLGSVKIPFSEVASALVGKNSDAGFSDIIWQFRLPKALTCLLAGAGLASAGLMMQSWFRNPLAGPDVLGLSSGASLLVSMVILAGATWPTALRSLSSSPWSVVLAASAGSMMVFLVIIVLARHIRNNASLLIVGLMISAATSSVVSVFQFLSPAENLQAFLIWTMGSVGGTDWREIRIMAIVLGVGLVLAIYSMKSLNALLLGENYAQSLGINILRSRFRIVLATSLMVGSVTAFCGPIAFVGLAVPHLFRSWMSTSDHKILFPAVMMGGAALLLSCDILAQLPGSTQILPLNAMTSLIGAPVVIWVVMKSRFIRS